MCVSHSTNVCLHAYVVLFMNHSDTRIISNMLQLTYQSFSQNWSINYNSSSSTIDSPMCGIGKLIAKWLKLNQSGIWSVFGRLLKSFRRKKSVSFRGGFVEKTNPQINFSKVYDWRRRSAWWLCICGICGGEKGDFRQISDRAAHDRHSNGTVAGSQRPS